MTDRELLELAAKAAGIEDAYYVHSEKYTGLRYPNPKHGAKPYHEPHQFNWNPLDDDGDALWLAVKLGLDVDCDTVGKQTTINGDFGWLSEDHNDPYAATRRAIVRAAAEIGKEMK